jgi:cadmium resistance protein CadD (predicted permease)
MLTIYRLRYPRRMKASPTLVLVGIAIGAFVSTNMDAFLLLVANVARAPTSRRATAGGFFLATALVLAVAWALAGASAVIPPAHTGLIGLVPFAMGLKQGLGILRRHAGALRSRAKKESAVPDDRPAPTQAAVHLGEALVLHLSLSADNLAVYSALLTDTLPHLRPVIVVTTLTLTVAWTALARLAIRIPGLSPVLLRYGQGIMTALLIGVGVYILTDTETDVLLPAAMWHATALPPG